MRDFIKEQIPVIKAQILEYQTAIDALVSNQVQQYSLNTGQSTQSVTRIDVVRLQTQVDSLYNRLATLEARLHGSSLAARPAW